jgi:zinc protease
MKTIRFLLPLLIIGMGMISCVSKFQERQVTLASTSDPNVSVRLVFNTGSQDDPAGKEGLAALTAEMLADASTLANSYDQILTKLYPMAASYSAQVDKELTVIEGRVHKDNWEAYYQLLKEAILQPAFKQEDFARIKTQTLNYLERTLRYTNDEELGKEALNQFIFSGTPYGHPEAGLIKSVKDLTLDDIKQFYATHFTRENLTIGLGGAVDPEMTGRIRQDMKALPEKTATLPAPPSPEPISGIKVLLIEKDTESTAISIGFPIDIRRSDTDFIALWLANSWFGEHRNSSSHLYQVIRETRGMNYGDYSYIEAFPSGGYRQFPPNNIARRQQIFSIWIRPVQNHARHFALRAAIRELQRMVDQGLTQEEFEVTQKFLSKYYLHFAPSTMERLGFWLDDGYYGLPNSFLETFPKKIASLTLEQVNAAIKKNLQYQNLKIVMVTKDAESLRQALIENHPSPMTYSTPKPESVLQEDEEIIKFPIEIKPENIRVVNVEEMFF